MELPKNNSIPSIRYFRVLQDQNKAYEYFNWPIPAIKMVLRIWSPFNPSIVRAGSQMLQRFKLPKT